MQWLDEQAKKRGFAGMHYQLVKYGTVAANRSGFDRDEHIYRPDELMDILPFSSLTHYQYVHFADMNRKYSEIMKDVESEWKEIEEKFSIPFFPHVSIGWDNTPRYSTHTDNVVKDNPPEEFKKALIKAKELADKNGVNLITINSWNEWTETSYLQPDDLYGYGYLEAVKQVFGEK